MSGDKSQLYFPFWGKIAADITIKTTSSFYSASGTEHLL